MSCRAHLHVSTSVVGTSSEEGVGLCFAICEHLLQRKVSVCMCVCVYMCAVFVIVLQSYLYTHKAFTFFATHFMELTNLETLYPNVEKLSFIISHLNMNMFYVIASTLKSR